MGPTLRPNGTNWFICFSRQLLLVTKMRTSCLYQFLYCAIWNTCLSAGSGCDNSLLYASLGRIGSSSHPSPAAGEHWAGEPAEKTGEFFQHFCRGVQPEPAASSPWSDGSRVPPSILQGPKEWTEDFASTGERHKCLIKVFRYCILKKRSHRICSGLCL